MAQYFNNKNQKQNLSQKVTRNPYHVLKAFGCY